MFHLKTAKKAHASPKHRALVDTARELFTKHGIKRVTIEEICEKAKVSKVTFYKYFKDKYMLAKYIGDEMIEAGFTRYDQINALDLSFPEKIDLITRWRIEFFSKLRNEFIEEIQDVEDLQQEIKKRYMKNIKEAQQKGEIKQDISIELIWLITEKLNELGKEGKWKSIFTDYSQFQKQLREVYFYGIVENHGKQNSIEENE